MELEPGADVVGVGVADFVEDVQGLGPGAGGGGLVAGVVVGVAEGGQGVGLVVFVADLPAQLGGALEAGDGLPVAALPVVDEAQAVPGRPLPGKLPVLLQCRERLLAVGHGLGVVAQEGVAVADVVEGDHGQVVVARPAVQVQGPLVVGQHLRVVVAPFGQPGQAAVRAGLGAGVATGRRQQPQPVQEQRLGVGEAACSGVAERLGEQGVRLPGEVTGPAGRCQGDLLYGGQVVPEPAA
jgi:hypothetical protein